LFCTKFIPRLFVVTKINKETIIEKVSQDIV